MRSAKSVMFKVRLHRRSCSLGDDTPSPARPQGAPEATAKSKYGSVAQKARKIFPFFCSLPWPMLFYLLFYVSSLGHRDTSRVGTDCQGPTLSLGVQEVSPGPPAPMSRPPQVRAAAGLGRSWWPRIHCEGSRRESWAWTKVPSPWHRLHGPVEFHLPQMQK